MGLFKQLKLTGAVRRHIDWDITPADTFGMFESWGGKIRVRDKDERFYYFYIDNWDPPARLFLMERGIKFARVLARIEAPPALLDACIATQGKGILDKTYAIDEPIRQWLLDNVVNSNNARLVHPIDSGLQAEPLLTGLPDKDDPVPDLKTRRLRSEPGVVSEEEVREIVMAGGFFHPQHNTQGSFANYLVDNGDGLTVSDLTTGIMWQRGGCDITSVRQVQAYIEQLNKNRFAGFDGWRLPTMEEALSLLEPEKNDDDLYLDPCFSREQPFIFLADHRKPGGYWFMDFKQAAIFWASGTIPGGFGRVCRTL